MKRLLIFVVRALFGLNIMAAPVEPKQALEVAKNFVAQHRGGVAQFPATVVYTHPMPQSGTTAIYVVNVGDAFVLVSGDDVAHPVLGYNLDNPWPVEDGGKMKSGSLPAQVTEFLDDLAGQMAAAVGSNQEPAIAEEWKKLATQTALPVLAPLKATGSAGSLPDSVGPLLTTTWDQGKYYNALCPKDANGPDGHACPEWLPDRLRGHSYGANCQLLGLSGAWPWHPQLYAQHLRCAEGQL